MDSAKGGIYGVLLRLIASGPGASGRLLIAAGEVENGVLPTEHTENTENTDDEDSGSVWSVCSVAILLRGECTSFIADVEIGDHWDQTFTGFTRWAGLMRSPG
jgi:hypothetical protein